MNATNDTKWLELRAWVEPNELVPGSSGWVVVEANIPEGGHIEAHDPSEPWLIPTVLEVCPETLQAGAIEYPPAEERRIAWSPVELRVLTGSVRFRARVQVPESAAAGEHPVEARLRYQACTQGACLPPNAQTVVAKAIVRG